MKVKMIGQKKNKIDERISLAPDRTNATASKIIAQMADRKVSISTDTSASFRSLLFRAKDAVVAVFETSPPKKPVRIAPVFAPRKKKPLQNQRLELVPTQKSSWPFSSNSINSRDQWLLLEKTTPAAPTLTVSK